jgi:hypothetical protein
MCLKDRTNHLNKQTMELSKLKTLKAALEAAEQTRIAVVQQASVSMGTICIGYEDSQQILYYDVKMHPVSRKMTLYMYATREDKIHSIPSRRVYQCPITSLSQLYDIIKRLHKPRRNSAYSNKRLDYWGAPIDIEIYPVHI